MTTPRQPRDHEYQPEQLVRFHLINIINQTAQLSQDPEPLPKHPWEPEVHLRLPDGREFEVDSLGLPTYMPPDETTYQSWAKTFRTARAATALQEPSKEKTQELQRINSCLYSIVAIIKLLVLGRPKPEASSQPQANPQAP